MNDKTIAKLKQQSDIIIHVLDWLKLKKKMIVSRLAKV